MSASLNVHGVCVPRSIGAFGAEAGTHMDRRVVNLPVQTTPLLGREAELTQIAAYLADAECRLLTLVGPGGVGKSRLAYRLPPVSPPSSPMVSMPGAAGRCGRYGVSGGGDCGTPEIDFLTERG